MWPMRWCLSLLYLSVLLAAAASADDGPHWQTNLDAAKRQAAQSNRLVLAHFWAPWCGPCRKLETTVFNQPGVAAAMEARFVPVKINVDDWPATSRNFEVERLPTDVIMAPDGRVLYKLGCPQDPAQYVAQLSQAAVAASAIASQSAPPRGQSFAADSPNVPIVNPQVAVDRQPLISQNVGPLSPNAGPPGNAIASRPNPWGQNAGPASSPQATYAGLTRHDDLPTPPGPPALPPATNNPIPPAATLANPSAPVAAPGGPQVVAAQPSLPADSPALFGLDGYCPVTLVERSQTAPQDPRCWTHGNPRWGAVHRGVTYLFTGAEEQKRFLQQPDQYAPALSGNDAVMAFDRGQLLRGRRENGVFFENRIYLFASAETLQRFQQDPRRYADEVRQAENPPHGAVR
jgi:thiol-disulfide isomerase/thioredoxin/YHS domain-containing protein